jgi:hypothetical protein
MNEVVTITFRWRADAVAKTSWTEDNLGAPAASRPRKILLI